MLDFMTHSLLHNSIKMQPCFISPPLLAIYYYSSPSPPPLVITLHGCYTIHLATSPHLPLLIYF
jgi:hypothetical protein